MNPFKKTLITCTVLALALSGCQQAPAPNNPGVENELRLVKEELERTREQLKAVEAELETYKENEEADLMETFGHPPIENKEEKISAMTVALGELSALITTAKDETEISKVLDEFMQRQSDAFMYVYFGSTDDVFIVSPAIELPDDYTISERPVYMNAVEHGLYIADVYIDMVDDRPVQTMSKALYVNNQLIGVVGIDVFLD